MRERGRERDGPYELFRVNISADGLKLPILQDMDEKKQESSLETVSRGPNEGEDFSFGFTLFIRIEFSMVG